MGASVCLPGLCIAVGACSLTCQYGHSHASQKPLEKAFYTVSQISEGISLNQEYSTLACRRQGQEKVWQCASVGLNLKAQEMPTLYLVLPVRSPGPDATQEDKQDTGLRGEG